MRELGPAAETLQYSDEWLVDLYLRYGSVEEALRVHPETIPFSVAHFHRTIANNGLVKSAGRHASFPETLHFFREQVLSPGMPLERLYKLMPPSFKVSLSTLHRIYSLVEKHAVRRYATALIIAKPDNPEVVLVGNELTGNSRYGKRVGDISIPMSFSKKDELATESILRVLQHEFSTKLTTEGKLVWGSELVQKFVPSNLEPLMYVDIIDVRVGVFKMSMPEDVDLSVCSSYRVTDHRWMSLGEALAETDDFRLGVSDIISAYENIYRGWSTAPSPQYITSQVNLALLGSQ